MTQTQSGRPEPHPNAKMIGQELVGAAMILAGSLVLSGLVYISNDPSPLAEHLLFRLGLALTSLISAGAQVLVVAGIAILWAGARRGRA